MNNSSPKIRFSEFTKPWCNYRLSSLIKSLNAGVSVNSIARPAAANEFGVLKTSCITTGIFISNENKAVIESFEIDRLKERVEKNTILISRMNTPQLVGANALVKEEHNNLFLPDRLWAVVVRDNCLVDFLAQYLSSSAMRHKISSRATGTSNSMKNITKNDVLTLSVLFPDFKEQEKIASFISAINDWIANLKVQKTELEIYKKGVFREILSQEIRFQDKNGNNYPDWKQYQLGELFIERNEKNSEKKHQLLSVKTKGGVVLQSEINKTDSSNSDKSKYKVVKVGDIAYNTMRMWQGASGVSQYEGIVSPAYTVVYPKNGDANFYGYLFKHPRTIFNFYRYSQGLTSDTWNLKFQHFSEVEVTVPSDVEEQKKIASFLSSFDELIEHKEKQIALAEQWKKGLLQQMFV